MKKSFATKVRQAVLGGAAVLLLPAMVLAANTPTTTSITFSPTEPIDGQILYVTGKTIFTGSGLPVVGETLQISFKQSTDSAYDPNLGVDCLTTGYFVQIPTVNENTDANGEVTKTFPTAGFGGKTFCFWAHHPADGGNHTENSASAETSIFIKPATTCSGPTLVNEGTSGGTVNPGGSVTGPWTVTLELNNCTGSAIDFKVQGGANAWAPLIAGSVHVSHGDLDYKVNKKTTVIIWNVTTSGTETITFGVGDGVTLQCGQKYLSGAWSAAYTDPNTGLPTKTNYTGQATVTGNACP